MLMRALVEAWRALRWQQMRRLGLVSLLLTIALLIAAYALLLMFRETLGLDIRIGAEGAAEGQFGPADPGLSALLGARSLLLMLVTSVLLMVPVAAVFAPLMLDDIAALLERLRWSMPPAPAPQRRNRLKQAVNFAGLVIAANSVSVILVVFLLPLFGFLALFLWFGVNGWLLGREYFTLVARRRFDDAAVISLRRVARGPIWLAGSLFALGLSLPLVNLFMPFMAGLWFTHILHRANAGG